MSVFSFDAVISVSGSSATKISASVAAFSVLSVVFPAISDTVSTALVSLSAAVSTVLVSSSAAVSAAPLHIFCRAAACCHANGHRAAASITAVTFFSDIIIFFFIIISPQSTKQRKRAQLPVCTVLFAAAHFTSKNMCNCRVCPIIIPYSNRFS